MKILLVGSKGNMGRRYASILNYLEKKFDSVDLEHIELSETDYDKIIIATPTNTHAGMIEFYYNQFPSADILCEKPFAKEIETLDSLARKVDTSKVFMVNNYSYYMGEEDIPGVTSYNYYKSGGDGLYWDCIQIIALARDEVFLSETSPVWNVKINGTVLDLKDIDMTYVRMIGDFLGPKANLMDWDSAYRAHQKVLSCLA